MVHEMRIVVGVDGSPCSTVAVEWAAGEAARRGARLDLVHVTAPEWVAMGTEVAIMPPQEPPPQPGYVDEACVRVREQWPELQTTCGDLHGSPAQVLIQESDDAGLIVVGARGRARVVEMVLGSVSRHLAAHSRSPVVIVHGDTTRSTAPVGIGIDDSPTARDALCVAAREAQWLGVPLVVVHAWQDLGYAAYGAWVPSVGAPEELARVATTETDEAVAQLAAQFPDLEIHVRTPMAHPVTAMRELSEEVQLLVVGAHGRGVFPGMLLGSVTSSAIHDSRCPVMVVPAAA